MIHVIRDGRDIAVGDLRVIATVSCASFYHGYNNTIDPDQKRHPVTNKHFGIWDQAQVVYAYIFVLIYVHGVCLWVVAYGIIV